MRQGRNVRQKLLWLAPAITFKSGCGSGLDFPITQCEDSMARNEGPIIQSDRSNPGRSVVVRTDPVTIVTPASLLIVPGSDSDPRGKATVMEIDGSDDESQVMTITLVGEALRYPDPLPVPPKPPGFPLPGQARSTAQIEWGMAGVQAQAFVDYQHGLSFSVPASWIRITAINEPLPVDDILGGNPIFGRNIRAGAFCSYGSVGRNGPLSAKKTHYIDVPIAAGDIGYVGIPPFATNFIFYPRSDNPATTGFIFSVTDQDNVLTTQPFTATVLPTNSDPIELPGSASALLISNAGPGRVAGTIIFGISI